MKIEKRIALCIIRAQMCSDAGKGLFLPYGGMEQEMEVADRFGYAHKPMFIIEACSLIDKTRGKSGFAYHISNEDWCPIVYFNFRVDGKRYQISFHVPEGIPARFMKNPAHKTRWDKRNSREACKVLAAWFKEGEKNV